MKFGHSQDLYRSLDRSDWEFPIAFEPSRFHKSKYVLNANTGDVLGVVGHKFNAVSHSVYFDEIESALPGGFGIPEQRTWTSRNGAWAMREYHYENLRETITTGRRSSDATYRIVAWHGIDGLTSNNYLAGSILSWCLNGMVLGDWASVRRKNTMNFTMDKFVDDIETIGDNFHREMEMCRRMARSPLSADAAEAVIRDLIPAERTQEKMILLAQDNMDAWGENVWGLYNAFTNFSTYADDRNGFTLSSSANDNHAERLHKRTFQVVDWISQPRFQSLLAA